MLTSDSTQRSAAPVKPGNVDERELVVRGRAAARRSWKKMQGCT
jgi:hypothetical protein